MYIPHFLLTLSGVVLYPLTLHVLASKKTIHPNFRAVLFMMTIAGFFLSFLSICDNLMTDGVPYSNDFFVFFRSIFVCSSLILTVERLFAVVFVHFYENHAHSKATIVFYAVLCVLPGSALAAILIFILSDPLYQILSFSILGLLAAIISLYIRCKIRSKMIIFDAAMSLRSRYQISENTKTLPVYLTISLNEMFGQCVVTGLFVINHFCKVDLYDEPMLRKVMCAYRVVFVEAVLVFLWLKSHVQGRNSVTTIPQSNQMQEHFAHLENMWGTQKAPTAPAANKQATPKCPTKEKKLPRF